MLETADQHAESLVGACGRDLVGLLHGLERGDVHALLERPRDPPPLHEATRVEYVRRSLAPWGVGHLRDHAVEAALGRVEEEERDRVEPDPEVARIREQADPTSWPPGEGLLDPPACPLRQGALAGEVIALPESRRRWSPGGPERDRIENIRHLVEVEQGHEDPVAEGVGNRPEPPMRHPPLVHGRLRHAAAAIFCAGGSEISSVGRPSAA